MSDDTPVSVEPDELPDDPDRPWWDSDDDEYEYLTSDHCS